MKNELIVKVSGQVLQSNLNEYKESILGYVAKIDTKKDLTTDQHFADARSIINACKEAEDKIDLVKHYALKETGDLDKLLTDLDCLKSTIGDKRCELNRKAVADLKKSKKAILDGGKAAVAEFLGQQHEAVRQVYVIDFNLIEEAIKGLQKIDSRQAAVDKVAGAMNASIQEKAELVKSNIKTFESLAAGHYAIFSDKNELLVAPEKELIATVEGRIAKAELEAKEREEGKARAERAAKDKEESDKKAAEVKEKADLKAEERAKKLRAEADEAAKRPMANEQKSAGIPAEGYHPPENAQVELIPTPHLQPSHVEPEIHTMTVIITGTRSQAEEVAKAVFAAVEPFKGIVESVNLPKNTEKQST